MGQVTVLSAQVDAHPAAHVHSHPRRTLTKEGALSVHAFPVDAHARKYLTLIHIFTVISSDSGISLSTDGIFFTLGAGAPPGLSERRTTVGLECGSININLTAIIDDLQPTGAFSGLYALQLGAVQGAAHRTQADEGAQAVHTVSIDTRAGLTLIHIFTHVRPRVKMISFRALTGEAARSVSAQAVLTKAPIHEALVDIDAVFASQINLKAFIACAFVCPQHVLTHSILADVRVQCTFVNISPISGNTATTGTQSQELRRALWRTGLAGLPVGILRVGTAALRLGHCPKQRSNALATPVPAIARAAHVRVHTDASVEPHRHPRHTLTPEGALRVHTVSVHAHPRSLTLINVYTHAPARVQQISRFTDAFETSIFIYAQPVQAHVSDQALVLVLTVLAI